MIVSCLSRDSLTIIFSNCRAHGGRTAGCAIHGERGNSTERKRWTIIELRQELSRLARKPRIPGDVLGRQQGATFLTSNLLVRLEIQCWDISLPTGTQNRDRRHSKVHLVPKLAEIEGQELDFQKPQELELLLRRKLGYQSPKSPQSMALTIP